MSKFKKIVISFVGIALTVSGIFGYSLLHPQTAQAASCGGGYLDCRPITFNHAKDGTADTTNYAALITGTFPYLATTAHGGKIQNTVNQTGGSYTSTIPADLIFTSDSSCGSKLTGWEFESYSSTTGATIAHVNVGTLTHSTNLTVYECFNNAAVTTQQMTTTATWDSNYKLIAHYPNGSTLSALDSTSVGANGTITGATATSTGQIDGAAGFSGTQYIDHPQSAISGATSATFSAWVRTTNASREFIVGSGVGVCSSNGFASMEIIGSSGAVMRSDSNNVNSGSSIEDGNWHYVVGIYTPTTISIQVDNNSPVVLTGQTNSAIGSSATLEVGNLCTNFSSGAFGFQGSIDDFRVSNSVRSASQILADYNNQSDPTDFYYIGPDANSTTCGSWSFCNTITFDSSKDGSSSTNNYVALFSTTTMSSLATVANGGKVQHTVNQSGGSYTSTAPADLIFTTDAGCSTQVPGWEIESYTASTGAIIVHVNIGQLPYFINGQIYMCYGNASVSTQQYTVANTWGSNYQAVYHLPNGSSLSPNDSTVNAINGTNNGATASTTGQIDGAASFNGTSQYIGSMSLPSAITPATGFTVSAWVYMTGSGSNPMILARPSYDIDFRFEGGSRFPSIQSNSGGVHNASSISLNTWTYIVGTMNNTIAGTNIYVNGSLGGNLTTDGSGDNTGDNFQAYEIGRRFDGAGYFPGNIDEVRVFSGLESADQILADYNNQNSPNTFYIVGAQQQGAVTATPPHAQVITTKAQVIINKNQTIIQ